jgi:putative transposase
MRLEAAFYRGDSMLLKICFNNPEYGVALLMKYKTDLNDAEWETIREILERELPYKTGRKKEIESLRDIYDAINYINKTGIQWEYLPNDYPPHTTVSYHYHKWKQMGLFEIINTELRKAVRTRLGRNENPTAGVIDSQSVKSTPEAGGVEIGVDGGKLVRGRKRGIVTDTLGFLIAVVVTSANIADNKAAIALLQKVFMLVPGLKKIWADKGYRGDLISWVKENYDCVVDITNKTWSGFKVEAKRWVVERTFAWLTRARRLAKEYEKTPESSAAMVYIASCRLLLRKLHSGQKPTEDFV